MEYLLILFIVFLVIAAFSIKVVRQAEVYVIERFGNYTFVEFVLETGRTHQIRVHSKHIGHTIVGDEVYGKKDKNFKTTGQLLHAYKIEFTQPTTNERLSFKCELDKEFVSALNKLKNQNN